jgi:dephospho-CoA kinase
MIMGRGAARLIAITGGMGSGKSTVSRFWATHSGLPHIDIDEVCRGLLGPGEAGWQALRALLPSSFFTDSGALDRQGLRRALFADAALRREVNRCVHPLARERMHEMAGRAEGTFLVDVPLLYEAGWLDEFAASVVVYARPQVCCRRLVARDSITEGEAAQSMAAQADLGEKALRADHVVDNSGCWLFTRLQVVHLALVLGAGPDVR